MGTLRARDLDTGDWVEVTTTGPPGPAGPAGPAGPPGASGAPTVLHSFNQTNPTPQVDGQDYELGTRMQALGQLYVVGVRVYSPGTATSSAGTPRRVKLWFTDGSFSTPTLQATATCPLTLAAGWNEIMFPNAVMVPSGQKFVVSYNVGQWGANDYAAGGYSPYTSTDGLVYVDTGAGRFDNTPGTYPTSNTTATTHYGVDALYTATNPGIGVPAGGTVEQVLTKNSATDGDASWQTITPIVAKSTQPVAADYGYPTIPVGAIWVQTP